MPENFEFLNVLASETQSGIRSNVAKFNRQSDNLGDIISNANQRLQVTSKKKQDSDFFFNSQANALSKESDNVTLNIARAKADPFHDLKVLFTDEKSIADYAVDQQKIQNEMNIVQRRFAGGASEYNAELSMIQAELTTVTQQRQLTKETLATSIQAAQGLSTAVAAKTNIVKQQFREMTLADMKQELAEPTIPNLPRGALEDAIREKEKLLVALNKQRGAATDTALEIAAKKFKVINEHPELIPTSVLEEAVRSNKSQLIPELQVAIDPQQAQTVLQAQGASQEKAEELIRSMSLNKIRSASSVRNVSQQLMRAQGGGDSLMIRDPVSGLAIGVNTDSLPSEEKDQFAKLQDANMTLGLIQKQIDDGLLQGQQLINATKATQALEGLVIATEKELSNSISKRAGDKYEGKLAKKSGAEFNERGIIESAQGAAQIGTELLSALTSTAVTSETFGPGWSVGMKSVQLMMDAKLQEYASLHPEMQGETEELDTQERILKMFSQKREQDLETLFAASIKSVNGRGDNLVGEVILQDWLEVGSAQALNHLINTVHVDDPASQSLLQSLLSSDQTLTAEITTANDGFSTLFTLIRMKERKAIADGVLSEGSNLVGELQTMLLKDQTYQQPFMTSLTTPTKDGGGMLNKLVFNNTAPEVFRQSMKQQIMSIPLANIDEAIDAAAGPGNLLSRGVAATGRAIDTFITPTSAFVTNKLLLGDLSTAIFGQGGAIDAVFDENQPQERSVFETAKIVLQNNPDLAQPKQ